MSKETNFDKIYDKVVEELRALYQQEFINKCKTDPEFSEKWGFQIEERELSLEDRKKIYEEEFVGGFEIKNDDWLESKLKTRNIPTKEITIKYNNEIIKITE